MEKKQLLAPVWRHWKHAFYKYRWYAIGTLVFYGLTTYLNDVYKVTIWRQIIDSIGKHNDPMPYFVMIPIVGIICWIINRFGDWCLTRAESNIIRFLKNYALERLVCFDTNFFLNTFAGSIGAKAKRFATSSESVFDEMAFTMIRVVIILSGIFFVAMKIVPIAGFILLAWASVFGFLAWYLSRLRTPHDLASANADTHTTGHLSDIIASVHLIHSYVREEAEYEQFTDTTSSEHTFRFRAWWHGNRQWAVQAMLVLILELALMYYVISQAILGIVSVGTVMLVQSFISTVSGYMWMFGRSLTKLRNALADAHEMAELMTEKEPTVFEAQLFDDSQKIIDHSVAFNNVKFHYPDRIQTVLSDVTFTIPSGSRFGVIGTTGSGKTTITRLLLRQFELSKDCGDIVIGGVSISKLSRDDVRKMISYVPQDPQFPFRSVRDIIALGKHDATDEEIIEAAKKASCHDFIIEQLDYGYNTKVGERGVKLSGGQRQRLAIAAAFLKDALIIILDEPTAALDSETEEAIQQVLKTMKNKTLIVIAHRLTTIAELDEIIVLKNGSVCEQGSHRFLIEKNGVYASFWKKQFHH